MPTMIGNEIRALLDSSPISATIAGDDGRFVFANRCALSLLGCTEAGILGTAVEDWYQDAAEWRAVGSTLAVDGEVRDREVRLRRQDGSSFWALISIRPWWVDGERVHVSWITDLTERKAAEARFLTLLEMDPDAMVIADRDGTIVQINRQLEVLFGYPSDELVGQPLELLLPERFRQAHVQARDHFVREPRVRAMGTGLELYGRKKDGSEFPVDVGLGPIETEEGVFACAAIQDLSQRKGAEEALRASEARLRSILDSSPIGVAIGSQTDQRILFANPRFAEMFHLEQEDLIGGDDRNLYARPEEREAILDLFRRDGSVRDAEIEMKRVDGTVFWSLMTLLPTDYQGEPARLAWHYDITRLKQAEAELAESEWNLHFALTTARAGMFELDLTSNEASWSAEAAKIFGHPRRPIENARAHFMAGVNVVDHGKAVEALTRHVEGKHDLYRADYRFRRPDGREIWIRATGRVVRTGSQEPRHLIGAVQDITAEKEAEEALRRAKERAELALAELTRAQSQLVHAEKMASLGQLTAGIAHEIKNPLNFVNNFAETSVDLMTELRQEITPALGRLDAEVRDTVDDLIGTLVSDLARINEHGRRADGIVKSMLLHARGEDSNRLETAINQLVSEALKLAYHGERAKDKSFQVTLEERLDDAAGAAEIVPQEILRVLVNLIGNAFYAVRQRARRSKDETFEPTVSVTTRARGNGIEIRVRDNGTGIPKDIRDKLFEPFFTTKPPGEGTGLGLSMCYDIVVQQHGGEMGVDSETGRFAEFRVLLPRRAGDGGVGERQHGGPMS